VPSVYYIAFALFVIAAITGLAAAIASVLTRGRKNRRNYQKLSLSSGIALFAFYLTLYSLEMFAC